MSSGSGTNDLEKMSSILEAVPQIKFICLDVANGYSEHFVEFVKLVRDRFPEHTIMVGMVEHSLNGGARREPFSESGGTIFSSELVGPFYWEASGESLGKGQAGHCFLTTVIPVIECLLCFRSIHLFSFFCASL